MIVLPVVLCRARLPENNVQLPWQADAQADLNLQLVHMTTCIFCWTQIRIIGPDKEIL